MAHERFKGAVWYEAVKGQQCFVLGCGGIGSHLAFYLARAGCNLTLFDDDVFDETNISGQFVRLKDINKNKAEALAEVIQEMCEEVEIETAGRVTEESERHHIIFSCFDNMAARKIAFNNWFQYLKDNPELREEAIFIDGRLNPNNWQIFTLTADLEICNNYLKEHLFDDSEVEELDCTNKQTTFMAANIASHMVNQFINFRTLVGTGKPICKIEYYMDFVRPMVKISKDHAIKVRPKILI